MLDVTNLNGPLIMFQAPVHGDTDQESALRAELFGFFCMPVLCHLYCTKIQTQPYSYPRLL